MKVLSHLIWFAIVLLVAGYKLPQKVKTVTEIYCPETSEIEHALLMELTSQGCVLPNVAVAQFKIETAHFTSRIYKECNNVAGIRNSSSDLVVGMKYGHCVYNSVEDCIKDYIRVQNRYLGMIDGRYAEDSNYIKLIRTVK
jgi:uncharacterized FlgJ-related protein